ncbi:MAG TPA: hypothetical protein VD905_07900 [Flavobacteriales bacterium]|nr:hypothetical protein [Flavobacteriales bacterium]
MSLQRISTLSHTAKKSNRYGVTEKKKAELDALTLEVLNAQQDVAQYQAIVNSLTQKLTNFQALLATADANRASALANHNLADQLAQNALDLANNSGIAFNEIVIADQKAKKLATDIKKVMDELIYSAEVINKLANIVVRKKAQNPLISDELVSLVGTAGNDANNAVALALVALQSAFASQAANMESEAATALEYSQSLALYELMTGKSPLIQTPLLKPAKTKSASVTQSQNDTACLQALFKQAYETAKNVYQETLLAVKETTTQLNHAQIQLNKAQVNLTSVQSGLAAGNAAALAS